MDDVTELTEDQTVLVRNLLGVYPGALGFKEVRPVLVLAAPLVDAGYLTALISEDLPGLEGRQIAYRVTDEYADGVRHASERKAETARWN